MDSRSLTQAAVSLSSMVNDGMAYPGYDLDGNLATGCAALDQATAEFSSTWAAVGSRIKGDAEVLASNTMLAADVYENADQVLAQQAAAIRAYEKAHPSKPNRYVS